MFSGQAPGLFCGPFVLRQYIRRQQALCIPAVPDGYPVMQPRQPAFTQQKANATVVDKFLKKRDTRKGSVALTEAMPAKSGLIDYSAYQ